MSICLCVLLLFVWVFIVGGEVVFVVVLFGVYCLFCLFVFILGLWLGLYFGGGWGGGDITLLYLWNFVCLSARGAVHGLTGDGWCSRLACTCSRL